MNNLKYFENIFASEQLSDVAKSRLIVNHSSKIRPRIFLFDNVTLFNCMKGREWLKSVWEALGYDIFERICPKFIMYHSLCTIMIGWSVKSL